MTTTTRSAYRIIRKSKKRTARRFWTCGVIFAETLDDAWRAALRQARDPADRHYIVTVELADYDPMSGESDPKADSYRLKAEAEIEMTAPPADAAELAEAHWSGNYERRYAADVAAERAARMGCS